MRWGLFSSHLCISLLSFSSANSFVFEVNAITSSISWLQLINSSMKFSFHRSFYSYFCYFRLERDVNVVSSLFFFSNKFFNYLCSFSFHRTIWFYISFFFIYFAFIKFTKSLFFYKFYILYFLYNLYIHTNYD